MTCTLRIVQKTFTFEEQRQELNLLAADVYSICQNAVQVPLHVTTTNLGTSALTYNSTTGEFIFTPPDLSGYSTLSHTHDYNTLTNLPTLFDGDYNSLTNKPTIPSSQVNSDWNATSGVTEILNKPEIGVTVKDETSGVNLGLAKILHFKGFGVQVTGTGDEKDIQINGGIQVQDEGTQLSPKTYAINFVGAGVTVTGTDATKTVSIPGVAYTEQADWNETTPTDPSYIQNKPTIFSGSYNDLTDTPTFFDGDYNNLTNKPTIPTNNNQLTNGAGYITGIGTFSIGALDDVDTTTVAPSPDKVLKWSGSNWVPGDASVVANLSDLGDVDVTNDAGTDGLVLKYQHSSGNWIAAPDQTAAGGSGISLTDLSVTVSGTPSGSGNLTYDDGLGVFTYIPPDFSSIGGIALTDISLTQNSASGSGALTYDDTTGEFEYTPPSIPAAQIKSDWNSTTGLSEILNKPTLFSGDYNDLTNKPNIDVQVKSDWDATTGLAEILNKPTLFSGDYNDLTNKPTIPGNTTYDLTASDGSVATEEKILLSGSDNSEDAVTLAVDANSDLTIARTNNTITFGGGGSAQIQADWTQTSSSHTAYIQNKPAIPAAQIQADWNQTSTSALDYIKNKPTSLGGGGSSDPVGTIVIWSGSPGNLPTGYQFCDGGTPNTTELQAIVGNNVPDLQDRFVLGASDNNAPDSTGGSADAIVVTHSHSSGNLGTNDNGNHNHNVSASGSASTTSENVYTSYLGVLNAGGTSYLGDSGGGGSSGDKGYHAHDFSVQVSGNTGNNGSHSHNVNGNTSNEGSSGTGANMPPYYALCYIIKHTAVSAGGGVNADWNATTGLAEILNKPALFSGSYNDLTNKPTLFSGSYNDLSNKPTLFSGSYNDLSDKPTIPAAQINSDWNATTGLGEILNKPTIPTNNNQLTNGSGYLTSTTQIKSDWNSTTGASEILNKPALFSGSYNDLTDTPTIPSSVQSDWNQSDTAAADFIKNKPSLDDDLDTVTGRGGTTTNDISVGNLSCTNLTVSGTTTTINSNTVNIGDNILVLNSDETSAPTQNGGIEIERGTSTNVSLRWNETSDKWQYTNDGTNFENIGGGFVSGMIMMYKGTTAPSGWVICDDSTAAQNAGAPDLRDRFIIGAGNTYSLNDTGGTADAMVVSHDHNANTVATGDHVHSVGANGTTNNTGGHSHGDGNYGTNNTGSHSHNQSGSGSGNTGNQSANHYHTTSTTVNTGNDGIHKHRWGTDDLIGAQGGNNNPDASGGTDWRAWTDEQGNHSHTFNFTHDTLGVSENHTHSFNFNIGGSTGNDGSHSHNVSGNSGNNGDHSHNLNISVNETSTGSHSHNVTVDSEGSSGTGKNLPPYYALMYIMKI